MQSLCRKWAGRALVVLSAFAVGVALVGAQAAYSAQAINLDTPCSVAAVMPDGSSEQYKDMPQAPDNLVFDLYKVADAQPMEGFDAYTFAPTDALQAACPDVAQQLAATATEEGRANVTAGTYREMAQQIARKTLMGGAPTLDKTASAVAVGDFAEVEPGLYLMVVRGAGLDEYVDASPDGGNVATFGLTPLYKFLFSPELVAVPGRSDGEMPNATSNGNVEWRYDVAATLKPEWRQRTGALEIVKSLTAMDASQEARFLFQVDAWDGAGVGEGNRVYSNVVALDFTAAGQQSVRVEGIPAGAWVSVSEVYSGANYVAVSSTEARPSQPIAADDVLAVAFENTYEYQGPAGGSVVNTFTYEEGESSAEGEQPSGQWRWSSSAQSEEGGQR